MDVKLLITDFDGTLVDTFEANFRAYREAFASVGLELSRECYRDCFGYRFDRFMEAMGIEDTEIKSLIRERKAEAYPNQFEYLRVNRPLLAFIRAFHSQGGMTAIASTARGKNLRAALRYIGIENDFNLILAGESVLRGKPHPEIYNKVLQAMDVKPEEALVFEDSEVGLEAAHKAGIQTIKVTPIFF